MSVPLVHNRFVDAGNLDSERVNDNLRAIGADAQKSIDRRYTYCRFFYPLAGMADTDAAVLRQVFVRLPAGITPARGEVFAVELVLCAADAATWTMALTDATQNWPSISVVDSNDVTVEAVGSESTPVIFDSNGVIFQLSASAASTLAAGSYAVIHLRFDRFASDAATAAGFVATPVDAASSTAAATLNNALAAAGVIVDADTADDHDLRIECFVIRNVASGTTVSWQMPSGQRRRLACHGINVMAAGAGKQINITVDGTTFSVSGISAVVAANIDGALAGSEVDDPMTPASDGAVSIAVVGGSNCLLGVALVVWS